MNARSILKELVAFDTSAQNSNLPLVHFIANMLDRPGCTIRLSHDDSGTKANLICAMGPAAKAGSFFRVILTLSASMGRSGAATRLFYGRRTGACTGAARPI
jgi:hypothetical protein